MYWSSLHLGGKPGTQIQSYGTGIIEDFLWNFMVDKVLPHIFDERQVFLSSLYGRGN